jgi:dolichol-phosphate mannosyltransferase
LIQLSQFALIGATGYLWNVGAFTVLVAVASTPYGLAAVCAFLVAVVNNYALNRLWTFRKSRGAVVAQGVRFVTVAVAALAVNLVLLAGLIEGGVMPLLAQPVAVALVLPLNFVGNKIWTFRT